MKINKKIAGLKTGTKNKQKQISDMKRYLEIIKTKEEPSYFFVKHIRSEIKRREKKILEHKRKLNKQSKGTIYESLK